LAEPVWGRKAARSYLDIQHQLGILRLITRLGLTSIVALHDLNHAAMFCDHLLVLDQGKVIANGKPTDVLTPDLLKNVFQVECDFYAPQDDAFHILFRK
jgi:iron complex transport system ATP-binding protein